MSKNKAQGIDKPVFNDLHDQRESDKELEDSEQVCVLIIYEKGRPELICPDLESQTRAAQAMEEHPEILLRVRPKLEEN